MVERIVPGTDPWDWMYPSHIARYQFALRWTQGKVVLDAACGVGYGSHFLARSASRVIGLDSAPDTVEFARVHFSAPNVSYHCADLTRPLTEFYANCDVVVSFETLEHLDRPEAFLDETTRVLRPSGLLLLSVPAAESGDNPFHKQSFSPDRLRQLLLPRFASVEFYCQQPAFPFWLRLARSGMRRWQRSQVCSSTAAPLTQRWKDPHHPWLQRLRHALKQLLIEQPGHWRFTVSLTADAHCWLCLCQRPS